MRFDSIHIQDIGPFESTQLDLSDIDGKIVAIAGDNGSGKSTLLELLAAGMYRTTPTRGRLSSLATSKESSVRVQMSNGTGCHDVTHKINALSSKGESMVYTDGKPISDTGSVRAFDAWSKETMPPPEVFYTSLFAPQGSGGFLELNPGDRKGVVLRTLGIEKLEKLATAARERTKSSKQKLEVVNARLEGSRGFIDLPQAQEARAQAVRKCLRAHLERVRAEKEVEAHKGWEKWSSEREALVKEQEYLEGHLETMLEKQQRIELTASSSNEIKVAERHAPSLKEQLKAITTLSKDLEVDIVKHETALRYALNDADGHRAIMGKEQDKIVEIEISLQEAPGIERAVIDLPKREKNRDKAFQELDRLVRTRNALKEEIEATTDRRIELFKETLEGILRETDSNVMWNMANDCCGKDYQILAEQKSKIEREKESEPELEELKSKHLEAVRIFEECRQVASRKELIEHMREELGNHKERIVAQDSLLKRAQKDIDWFNKKTISLKSEMSKAKEDCRDIANELRPLQVLLDKLPELERNKGVLGELQKQGMEVKRQITETKRAIDSLGEEPNANKDAYKRMLDADKHLLFCQAHLESSRTQEKQALSQHEATARAHQEQAKLERDISDYTKLSQDLGRSGIQAMEVDSAGPELTELVNDLLHTCLGTRWTVSVETQRASSDGKKTIEGCDIRVIDTKRGRDASADTLSGGEKVLVSEAISLALSMLACRRAGVTGATLVRDETGASLDSQAAVAYVSMLRRAAVLVDATHVLFVTHNPEVRGLADSVVWVEDGTVEVRHGA